MVQLLVGAVFLFAVREKVTGEEVGWFAKRGKINIAPLS